MWREILMKGQTLLVMLGGIMNATCYAVWLTVHS